MEEIVREEKKRNPWKFLFLAIILSVIVLLTGIVILYKITPEETHDSLVRSISFVVSPGKVVFKDKTKINVLCLGLDYNYTPEGIIFSKGARTDTIFAVSLDIEKKDINILSIPRDMLISLADGSGYEKANVAYALGDLEFAKRTFEEFLGVEFDYYVIFRIIGAKKIVDELGGVWIDVDRNMDYDDSWGNLHIHLKQGYQKLNGDQAVGFCRFRYDPMGDRTRIERQQKFVKAVIEEVKKPGNILKLEKLVRITKEHIETNLTFLQMLDLARAYMDFKPKNLHAFKLDGEDSVIGGLSVIVPDENLKEKLVGRVFLGTYSCLPEEIRLEILNGSKIEGLAESIADILNKKGYKIIKVGYAPARDYAVTQIVDRYDNPDARSVLTAEFGAVAVIKGNNGEGGDIDFTIIVGEDMANILNK